MGFSKMTREEYLILLEKTNSIIAHAVETSIPGGKVFCDGDCFVLTTYRCLVFISNGKEEMVMSLKSSNHLVKEDIATFYENVNNLKEKTIKVMRL